MQSKNAIDLTTVAGVTQFMQQSTSEADWNQRCDQVKAANNGYPSFWYFAIVQSGLASRCQQSWGR